MARIRDAPAEWLIRARVGEGPDDLSHGRRVMGIEGGERDCRERRYSRRKAKSRLAAGGFTRWRPTDVATLSQISHNLGIEAGRVEGRRLGQPPALRLEIRAPTTQDPSPPQRLTNRRPDGRASATRRA